MTEDRLARGRRVLGHPGLRCLLIVSLALIVAGVTADAAFADSGGSSVGEPGHRSAGHHRLLHKAPRQAVSPFAERGMWIWLLAQTDGGNLASIIADAHSYGIQTLIIKSGDGTGRWSQFNPQLVSVLHTNHLRVCAWQYVYGSSPAVEARVGAAAVRAGADCLVIDAEAEYQGKYVQAQTYISDLRSIIGANFPVALAGYPYIDFHPSFPYSVFLGPGGAQYNMPQMYWRDIGATTDAVFAHTYSYNRIYGRPIAALGQVYDSPPAHQILHFRQLSRVYGAPGVTWWDWQEATPGEWQALSRPVGSLADYTPYTAMATISKGAVGDLVVWAQEHLISAGVPLGVDGGFGKITQAAVEQFQLAHGLSVDGVIGPATWQALLRYRPARISWAVKSGRATIADLSGLTPVPKSAALPAKRYEIPVGLGAGSPGRP
jgi:peptidoglycan hydrolase-like protein with peptidoglycan-binding domain